MNGSPATFERFLPFLLAGSVAVILIAVGYYAEEVPLYWDATNGTEALLWIGACLLLAALLRSGTREQALPLFSGALVLYLATGVGLQESATALLFFSACYLYGRILLAMLFSGAASAASGATRPLLIGLAVQLTYFGVLIHAPLNSSAGYLAVQFAPLLLLGMTGQLPAWSRQLGTALGARLQVLNTVPYWYGVVLLILIGTVARYAFFPTLSADDNALHLRMWTELALNGQYSFDVVSQIWEVSPFAVSLMHAVISLMAGDNGRGALNLILLALLCRQLWAIAAQLGVDASGRLLLVVLFISTPMAGFLLITLQTELFLAVLATAGVRLALEAPSGWYNGNTTALLCVAALCCAVKLPGAVLGVLLLAAALVRQWPLSFAELSRHGTLSKLFFACTILGLGLLALNSYVTAWRITGNPLFPLYNGIFRSPFSEAANFSDDRWMTGFSLASYWNLFFNTNEHYESDKFVAGFQYLFLLPLALPLLWRRLARRTALTVLVPLLGFGLVMFSVTQYWRYMFPVFPLAVVVIGMLLVNGHSGAMTRYRRVARATIGACILLNFWFYPGVSWMLGTAPSATDTDRERELLAYDYLPPKALSAHVSKVAPGSQVLYHPDSPYGASLAGDPIYLTWYAPSYLEKAGGIRDQAGVRAFLQEFGIDFVIWNMDAMSLPGDAQWLLKDYLSRFGEPVMEASTHMLFRLQEAPRAYREVFRSEQLQATGAPLTAGAFATGGANVARFTITFNCADSTGNVFAKLLWDSGWRWQRLIPCSEQSVTFTEALIVPAAITSAELQISVQNAAGASVDSITLETD